jgi:hypothetical protein
VNTIVEGILPNTAISASPSSKNTTVRGAARILSGRGSRLPRLLKAPAAISTRSA